MSDLKPEAPEDLAAQIVQALIHEERIYTDDAAVKRTTEIVRACLAGSTQLLDRAPIYRQKIYAALLYWREKKLAVDAARPDFTRDQMRELNAAESRLLALDIGPEAGVPDPPSPTSQRSDP